MDKVIELWTYGSPDHDVDFGISFKVPVEWLSIKLKDMGLEILDEEYSWDLSHTLHNLAIEEKVIIERKCGKFGHVLI